jgi:hypothetical protein
MQPCEASFVASSAQVFLPFRAALINGPIFAKLGLPMHHVGLLTILQRRILIECANCGKLLPE